MKKSRVFLALFSSLVILSLTACGEDKTSGDTAKRVTESVNVCSLLTQAEVDSLFAESPGPGRQDSPVPAVQGCVWPAEGIPDFIMQVVSAPAKVRDGINPGEGYRLIDLEGLSGEAAVAIQQAKPEFGLAEGVAILGIRKDDRMLTLSPVRLDIKEGTPRFELLKQLADSAADRL